MADGTSLVWLDELLQEERRSLLLEMERRHRKLLHICAQHLESDSTVPSETWLERKTSEPFEIEHCKSKPHPEALRILLGDAVERERNSWIDTSWFSLGRTQWPKLSPSDIVDGTGFELFFACVILACAVWTCFELQFEGMQVGYAELQYPGITTDAETAWPGATLAFEILDYVFGFIFTVEVALKVIVLRRRFLSSCWNFLDTFIVSTWLLSMLLRASLPFNPMILRLCRVARLLRVVRIVKCVQFFDSLHLLIGSVSASISVLSWSLLLLVAVIVLVAIFMNYSLSGFIRDSSVPLEIRCEIYELFGTMSRSVLTMCELTLANWGPISRQLSNHVHQLYGYFMVLYQCMIGFAVVKVITGVFLAETMKVANTDDDLMVVQKARATKKHIEKMTRLFQKVDNSGDGKITADEWQLAVADPRTKTWLAAMELDMRDVELLFRLLADSNQTITPDQLVHGVQRLKGAAKNLDIVLLLNETQDMRLELARVCHQLQDLSRRNFTAPCFSSQVFIPPACKIASL